MRPMKQIRNISIFVVSLLVTGWMALVGQEKVSLPPLRTASLRATPPALPEVKDSPIRHLHNLLAANQEKRRHMLDQHDPNTRAFWERKLGEYSAMDPTKRDQKLREAQLHWYLLLILRTPDEDRDTKLLQIPPADRGLIQNRIKDWSALSESMQMDIMTHLPVLRYFGRLVSLSPEERREAMEASLEKGNRPDMTSSAWGNLDPSRRRAMFLAYQKFFTLADEKRERVLAKIPLPQRRNVQSRLEQLENLSPEAKKQCLAALAKYAQMTLTERILFRANAERWKSMLPSEHAVWKNVVKKLPPLPPIRSRSLPPIPRSSTRQGSPLLPGSNVDQQ
jgi:hypothetical protein